MSLLKFISTFSNSGSSGGTTTTLTNRQQVADRYAALAGTSTVERQALIDFVADIDPVYEKVVAFWPQMGALKKYDLIDPSDSALFTLTFPTGEPTHHAKGYSWEGDGKTADTGMNWFRIIGKPKLAMKHYINIGAGHYLQTAIQNNWFGAALSGFQLYVTNSTTIEAVMSLNGNSNPIPYTTNSPGSRHFQRYENDTIAVWKNSTKLGTETITNADLTGSNIMLNKNIVTAVTTISSAAWVTLAMTDSEVSLFLAAVETLMQTTGRSVL